MSETAAGIDEHGPYIDTYRFSSLRPHPEGPISQETFTSFYDLAYDINQMVGANERQNTRARSDPAGTEPGITINNNVRARSEASPRLLDFSIDGGGFITNYSLRDDAGKRRSPHRGETVVQSLICGDYTIHEHDTDLSAFIMARGPISERALLKLYLLVSDRALKQRFYRQSYPMRIYRRTAQMAISHEASLHTV